MAFVDLVEFEKVKVFLGIKDDDTRFDEEIIISIPFYVARLQKLLGIDFEKLSEVDQDFLVGAVSVMIACHLMKSDPTYGIRYASWKVGDSGKSFDKRTQQSTDTWCDLLDELLSELGEMFGDPQGDANSAKRISIQDTYTTYY